MLLNISMTNKVIGAARADAGADLSGAPTVRACGTDVQPYKVEAILRRYDATEPWTCPVVIIYGHEAGDTSPVPRIIPVQFNDPAEDWSKAPQWIKDMAGHLIAEITG